MTAVRDDAETLDTVLAQATEIGNAEVAVQALNALARLAAAADDASTARSLLEKPTRGHRRPPMP